VSKGSKNKVPRIGVDANVLIAAFSNEPTTSQEIKETVHQAFSEMAFGRLQIVSSDLLRGEVLYDQRQALDVLLACPHFEEVLKSTEVSELAGRLRERCSSAKPARKIALPDAIYVATAILARCDELWTTDGKLLKAAVAGLIPEIPVRLPALPQGVLFLR
jgi:predicted nucleic acid-binding protein